MRRVNSLLALFPLLGFGGCLDSGLLKETSALLLHEHESSVPVLNLVHPAHGSFEPWDRQFLRMNRDKSFVRYPDPAPIRVAIPERG